MRAMSMFVVALASPALVLSAAPGAVAASERLSIRSVADTIVSENGFASIHAVVRCPAGTSATLSGVVTAGGDKRDSSTAVPSYSQGSTLVACTGAEQSVALGVYLLGTSEESPAPTTHRFLIPGERATAWLTLEQPGRSDSERTYVGVEGR